MSKVKQLRKQKNLTQAQLAKRSGTSLITVGRLERGELGRGRRSLPAAGWSALRRVRHEQSRAGAEPRYLDKDALQPNQPPGNADQAGRTQVVRADASRRA